MQPSGIGGQFQPPAQMEPCQFEQPRLPLAAGVIPITQTVGAAIPDPKLNAGVDWPEHLRLFADDRRFDAAMTEHADEYQPR
jgi:hypothetical protein